MATNIIITLVCARAELKNIYVRLVTPRGYLLASRQGRASMFDVDLHDVGSWVLCVRAALENNRF
jgi:hypothetical protein